MSCEIKQKHYRKERIMTNIKENRKIRIEWADISKGIGILLVIIGHCVYIGGGIHNWIFSFHMPLFFILSGMFLREEPVLRFVRKKSRTLLIPYVVFCIIGLIITAVIPQWRNMLNLKNIIADIYLASPDYINVSSVWFLVTLFLSSLMFQLCLKLKKLAFVGIILLGSCGFYIGLNGQLTGSLPAGKLPLRIDVAMTALLFLSIGYYGKNLMIRFTKLINKKFWLRCGLCFILFAVSIIVPFFNGRVNIHEPVFNNLLIFIPGACVGTVFVIVLSVSISRMKVLQRIFVFIGQNSLIILGVQSLLIRLYILAVISITGEEYKLYYLPPVHALISAVTVTFFSIAIVIAYNYISKRIKEKKTDYQKYAD